MKKFIFLNIIFVLSFIFNFMFCSDDDTSSPTTQTPTSNQSTSTATYTTTTTTTLPPVSINGILYGITGTQTVILRAYRYDSPTYDMDLGPTFEAEGTYTIDLTGSVAYSILLSPSFKYRLRAFIDSNGDKYVQYSETQGALGGLLTPTTLNFSTGLTGQDIQLIQGSFSNLGISWFDVRIRSTQRSSCRASEQDNILFNSWCSTGYNSGPVKLYGPDGGYYLSLTNQGQNGYLKGLDGQWGIAGVDDNNNGSTDDLDEAGACGSDDIFVNNYSTVNGNSYAHVVLLSANPWSHGGSFVAVTFDPTNGFASQVADSISDYTTLPAPSITGSYTPRAGDNIPLNTSGLAISWPTVAGANSYHIGVSKYPDWMEIEGTDTTSNTYIMSNVLDSTDASYFYMITAKDNMVGSSDTDKETVSLQHYFVAGGLNLSGTISNCSGSIGNIIIETGWRNNGTNSYHNELTILSGSTYSLRAYGCSTCTSAGEFYIRTYIDENNNFSPDATETGNSMMLSAFTSDVNYNIKFYSPLIGLSPTNGQTNVSLNPTITWQAMNWGTCTPPASWCYVLYCAGTQGNPPSYIDVAYAIHNSITQATIGSLSANIIDIQDNIFVACPTIQPTNSVTALTSGKVYNWGLMVLAYTQTDEASIASDICQLITGGSPAGIIIQPQGDITFTAQ